MKLKQLEPVIRVFSGLSKREKMVLYGASIFVFVALLDRLVIGPTLGTLQAMNKDIREKEMFIKRDVRIVEQKQRVVAEKNKYVKYLSASLTQEEQFTVALKEVENIANNSGVYIIDMKPGGVKKQEYSEKYFVNLNCEAKMESIAKFMYSLETSDSLLTIEKFQITPKSGESKLAIVNMVISKSVIIP